ncbi:MAG: hypothetical protein HXY49_07210 [Ignavibacteriaceae bacterium]|nr:hypothetical protein [Ignavibacteriaceae bacterium]
MKPKSILALLIIMLSIPACTMLVLQPVNFAWPIESVVIPDENGIAKEERYSLSFNTKQLFFEEVGDSLAYLDKELRVIRNSSGYYFITGNRFKNVYVFKGAEGALELENKIFLSEFGVEKPAFNQRPPYVELVDGNKKLYLTHQGIETEAQN